MVVADHLPHQLLAAAVVVLVDLEPDLHNLLMLVQLIQLLLAAVALAALRQLTTDQMVLILQ